MKQYQIVNAEGKYLTRTRTSGDVIFVANKELGYIYEEEVIDGVLDQARVFFGKDLRKVEYVK